MSVDRVYPVPRRRDRAREVLEQVSELQEQIESLETELDNSIMQNRQRIEEIEHRTQVPDAPDEGRGPGSEPE